MPTVVAMWTGQCRDISVQENLCAKLVDLGDTSHRMYKDFFAQEIPIRHYDEVIRETSYSPAISSISDPSPPASSVSMKATIKPKD